jgi:catechol 2,3-dioxygenase-like lactoylglutathione lyase family enzyme
MTTDNPWINFTHIGVVTRDIAETARRYEAMGVGPFTHFELPSADDFMAFRSREHFGMPADDFRYKVAWGKWGAIAMELFQPVSGDSIPQRFLNAKGEGVWHYGYDVEDMAAVEAYMAERGYRMIGSSETTDGVKMCYFGTDDHGGVYFQAHEVPPGSNMYERLAGSAEPADA